MRDLVNRMLGPVRQRLDNLVARAVVSLVDDAPKLQTVQLQILDEETRDGAERFQQYGFTSRPLPGAEALVVFPGGHRALALVTNVDDRRYRLTGLQGGEVALYTDEGDYVRLKRGRIIEVKSGTKVRVDAPLVECTGDLSIAGSLTVSGDATVSGTVTGTTDVVGGGKSLKTHTHSGVQTGPGTSGPPS